MINYLRQFVKKSQSIAVLCLILSLILNLIFKQGIWEPDNIPGTIIFYSLVFAYYSIVLTLVTIIVLIINSLVKKDAIWKSINKEVKQVSLSIALFLIIYFVNQLIIKTP